MSFLLDIKKGLNDFMTEERDSEVSQGHFSIENSFFSCERRYEEEIRLLEQFPSIHSVHDQRYIVEEGKVFFNVCPHRGARLKKSENHYVCPYHGWSFHPDGLLRNSTGHHCPYKQGTLRLQEAPLEPLAGMMFSRTPKSSSAVYHSEIQTLANDFEFVTSRSNHVECQWKLLVESLLETYHFPFAHTGSLGSPEKAFFSLQTSHGHDARFVIPMDNFESTVNVNGLQGINIMYYLFPYTFVLFLSSGFVWFKIEPQSKSTCRLTSYLFRFKSGLVEKAEVAFNFLDHILHQDFAILKDVQQNLAVERRFFYTPYEKLIHKFHNNLKDLMVESG